MATGKFNNVMSMFLTDLAASVPEVPALGEARDWMTALKAVDPENDKVMRIFMDAMKGAKDIISAKNPSIFQNFSMLPTIISQEDMWNVFRKLSDADKKVCWKYLSKLFNKGKEALMELGEYDEDAECDMSLSSYNASTNNTLQAMIGSGPQSIADLQNIVMPQGPIVAVAFNTICVQYVQTLQTGLRGDAAVQAVDDRVQKLIADGGDDGAQLLEDYQTVYGSTDMSQALMTNTKATVLENGLPLFEGGSEVAQRILGSASNPDDIIAAVMQLGTLALTLQSVDSKTIVAVEDVARNFVKMIQDGEIDISQMAENPFQLLETLAASGVADQLMEMLGAAQQQGA